MNNIKNILFNKMVISLLITILFKLLFFRPQDFFEFDIFFISIIVLLVWTGNLQIDSRLNKNYSWISNTGKRLFLQITFCSLYSVVVLFISMFLLHQLRFRDGALLNRKMLEVFLPALFLTFAILATIICIQFFKAWKQSLIDIEKYKTESANAQLQNLKNQLSPHFLFNNLSVLTSLVYKNQDKAAEFISELSKVYRYALERKNSELVPLHEELSFLEHYLYLLKIRFENSIIFNLTIDEVKANYLMPPMCLQMLVENTIQHNEASNANPLPVSIYTDGNSLVIENPVQPRSDVVFSSKTGLENIQTRYSFFTDIKVEIINDGKLFKVVLPLIGIV